MSIYVQSVTRLRATETIDRTNDVVLDWTDPDELVIDHLSVQPAGSMELLNGRDETVTGWHLISRRGVDIDLLATDRVRLTSGEVCFVVGDVERWPSRSGGVHHVQAQLKQVVG